MLSHITPIQRTHFTTDCHFRSQDYGVELTMVDLMTILGKLEFSRPNKDTNFVWFETRITCNVDSKLPAEYFIFNETLITDKTSMFDDVVNISIMCHTHEHGREFIQHLLNFQEKKNA